MQCSPEQNVAHFTERGESLMDRVIRQVISAAQQIVIAGGVMLCGIVVAFAQTADEPGKLRGAIDDEESGILGADIAASDALVDETKKAFGDEVRKDLGVAGIGRKEPKNPQFFAPQQTPSIQRAPAKPTGDSSLESIEEEIKVLEDEAKQLQDTPSQQLLTPKPTLDSSLESIADEIRVLEEETKQLR